MSRAHLSIKQRRFVEEYADIGNATEAAKRAGYKDTKAIHTTGWENLQKPAIKSALAELEARIDGELSAGRVKRRLHEISHAAEAAGQFGPAVRAEELIGKSLGMWIDQSITINGQLKDEHILALLDNARRRQLEPVQLQDDSPHNRSAQSDD